MDYKRTIDAGLQKTQHADLILKFLIIGDYGVGKTAIVRRYTEGKFSSNYKITIGADFSLKVFQWDRNTRVSLQLWDIAGNERFGYMTRVYYKYAVGCAIVFDVSRYATFQSAKRWLNELRDRVVYDDGRHIPIVLLANKSDIEDKCISQEEISKFCRENEINQWFETSAKENLNIENAMKYLLEEAIKLKKSDEMPPGVSLNQKPEIKKRQECCN